MIAKKQKRNRKTEQGISFRVYKSFSAVFVSLFSICFFLHVDCFDGISVLIAFQPNFTMHISTGSLLKFSLGFH